jgi:leader peptidase (prepilin peptidase) / N-methyltransferase
MLAVLCAVLGYGVGWFLPDVLLRLPERSSASAADMLGHRGENGGSVATAEPTYVHLAVWPPARRVLGAATAAVYLLVALARGLQPDLPAFLVLGALGVALGYVDVRRHRLPDALTFPAFAAGALLLAGAAAAEVEWGAYARAWLGAVVLAGFYLLLVIIRPADMGLGDVKLAAVLGLYLGWLGWAVLVVGAFLGFLFGGLLGLALVALRRATMRTSVPAGPTMLLGALAAVVWTGEITALYLAD